MGCEGHDTRAGRGGFSIGGWVLCTVGGTTACVLRLYATLRLEHVGGLRGEMGARECELAISLGVRDFGARLGNKAVA